MQQGSGSLWKEGCMFNNSLQPKIETFTGLLSREMLRMCSMKKWMRNTAAIEFQLTYSRTCVRISSIKMITAFFHWSHILFHGKIIISNWKFIIYITLFLNGHHRNGYETVSQFHSVFVYEEDLREFVRTQLQKRDRVLVSGTVLHKTHTDAEGKRKYSGVIVANSIHKVAKRANSNEPEESAWIDLWIDI